MYSMVHSPYAGTAWTSTGFPGFQVPLHAGPKTDRHSGVYPMSQRSGSAAPTEPVRNNRNPGFVNHQLRGHPRPAIPNGWRIGPMHQSTCANMTLQHGRHCSAPLDFLGLDVLLCIIVLPSLCTSLEQHGPPQIAGAHVGQG